MLPKQQHAEKRRNKRMRPHGESPLRPSMPKWGSPSCWRKMIWTTPSFKPSDHFEQGTLQASSMKQHWRQVKVVLPCFMCNCNLIKPQVKIDCTFYSFNIVIHLQSTVYTFFCFGLKRHVFHLKLYFKVQSQFRCLFWTMMRLFWLW